MTFNPANPVAPLGMTLSLNDGSSQAYVQLQTATSINLPEAVVKYEQYMLLGQANNLQQSDPVSIDPGKFGFKIQYNYADYARLRARLGVKVVTGTTLNSFQVLTSDGTAETITIPACITKISAPAEAADKIIMCDVECQVLGALTISP